MTDAGAITRSWFDANVRGRSGLRFGVVCTVAVLFTAGLVGFVNRTIASAGPTAVTLTALATGFPHPIAIDYYEPTNQVIVSDNYSNGLPHNFDLVAANGTFSAFPTTPVTGKTNEVYMTAIRSSSCEGGFTVGDVYFGTGAPGQIGRISNGVVTPNWVTLPGETGLLRGGLFQDVYCSFQGALIVSTDTGLGTKGNVWTVTSAGVTHKVASAVGDTLEGPTTVPNNVAKYGPWAGKILVTSEVANTIESVDSAGTITTYTGYCGMANCVGGTGAEAVHIVPPNENFYGVDYAASTLRGAPASQFANIVGDIVVATEVKGRLLDVEWDPTANSGAGGFNSYDLLTTDAQQWEGTTFAPAALPGIAGATLKICKVAGFGVSQNTMFPFIIQTATVTALSNAVNVNTFAGAGVLNVGSTGGLPPSGTIYVKTSTGIATLTYTGVTGTTLTGVTTTVGTGTLATGGAVSLTKVSVPAGPAPGGYCELVGSFSGTVTIVEGVPGGDRVTGISSNAALASTTNPATGTAAVVMSSGVSVVTYTDSATTSGYLEICKKVAQGTPVPAPPFVFTVGTQPVVVPAGACSPPINVAAGPAVTVTEAANPAYAMEGCTAQPLPAVCDPVNRTATVNVAAGGVSQETILTVTNGKCTTVTDAIITGSTFRSATAHFTQADKGSPVTGTGIPAGTVISTVVSATTVVMSHVGTASAVPRTIKFC